MDRKLSNLPLNPLRTFAVASRHRTFTAAANHMGVTQVAISRQIVTLENYLGVKLFERSVRSVKLTEAGRAFGHEVAVHFDALERATVIRRHITQRGRAQSRVFVGQAIPMLMDGLSITRGQAAMTSRRFGDDPACATRKG